MTSEAPTGTWRTKAVIAVIGAFALQASATLAVYFHHQTVALTHTVRIEGDPTPLAGASAALRVGVYEIPSNRPARVESAVVGVLGPEGAVIGEPSQASPEGIVRYVAPVSPFELLVDVRASGLGERLVRAPATPRSDREWVREDATYTAPTSVRRPNLSATAGDQPGVRILRAEDECPTLLSVASNGGVAAVGLENLVHLRFTDEAGAPIAGLPIVAALPHAGARAQLARTDTLGIAELRVTPEGSERREIRFECGAETVVRMLEVVPSWDGLIVRPREVTVGASETMVADAWQQRSWGVWHQDVYCDDAWVATQTLPVRHGVAGFFVGGLSVPARPGGVRLCLVQGYTILFSPDPPRSVHYFLLRDDVVSARSALLTLAESARQRGAPALVAQLGSGTLAALESADPSEADRFGRWLSNSLPQPFVSAPLLEDDRERARAEFGSRHSRRTALLVLVLLLDAVVLLAGVFGYLVPRVLAQRRALALVTAEIADADVVAEVTDGGRSGVGLALGALVIGACLLGFVVLLVVLT